MSQIKNFHPDMKIIAYLTVIGSNANSVDSSSGNQAILGIMSKASLHCTMFYLDLSQHILKNG